MATMIITPFVERQDNQIDWTSHANGTNDFAKRLADAYLGNTFQSDMEFFVEMEAKTIPAHSLIVAAASPVLDRCIIGTGDINNTDGIVCVPDCRLAEFNVMLRYIYTGLAEIPDIETASVLLPLAHYFELRYFEVICADFIAEHMSATNVCQIYNNIHLMDHPLTQKCIELMQSNIDSSFVENNLMEMGDAAFAKIFDENLLVINSKTMLFDGMDNFSNNKCHYENIPTTGPNKRTILENRLKFIRFEEMTCQSFFNCISDVGPGFFTSEEISSTMLRITMLETIKAGEHHLFEQYPVASEQASNCNEYNGTECIYSTDCTTPWSLIGFETDADVIRVSDQKLDSSANEIHYTKVGKWITFTKPPVSVVRNGLNYICLYIILATPENKQHARIVTTLTSAKEKEVDFRVRNKLSMIKTLMVC